MEAARGLEAGGVSLVGDQERDEGQTEKEGHTRKERHAKSFALTDPGPRRENDLAHGIANKQAACRSLCESGSE